MLPLLVNLATLICLCVYVLIQQKMCLVHPLVATLGNISRVCKKIDSSFCLCVLELLFPCLGRGNIVGKSVQEELLESRTPSSQVGLPRDRVTELFTTRVQRTHGMIIFLFTPPSHPATSNCCFCGAEAKLWKRLVVGFFPHAQEKSSNLFEALALRLNGKTPCQGGRYR